MQTKLLSSLDPPVTAWTSSSLYSAAPTGDLYWNNFSPQKCCSKSLSGKGLLLLFTCLFIQSKPCTFPPLVWFVSLTRSLEHPLHTDWLDRVNHVMTEVKKWLYVFKKKCYHIVIIRFLFCEMLKFSGKSSVEQFFKAFLPSWRVFCLIFFFFFFLVIVATWFWPPPPLDILTVGLPWNVSSQEQKKESNCTGFLFFVRIEAFKT